MEVWSREKFIAEPSKGNKWLLLKSSELPNGFQGEVFTGKNWGENEAKSSLCTPTVQLNHRVFGELEKNSF